MISSEIFTKYHIGDDEFYLPLCGNDIDQVHREKYQMFLDNTDKKILQNIREKALGIDTSLSDEEYLQLECQRQYAVDELRRLKE